MRQSKMLVVASLVMAMGMILGAVQAQTTVISDTFTLTTERTQDSLLAGQTTEIGNRIWLGETSTSYYRYTLTAEGQVARTGPNTHQDRVAGVPYVVNPAGEVVTISADMTWTDSSAYNTTNANSVGFMPFDAPWDGAMIMASRASLSVYMYATGKWIMTAYDPVSGLQSNFIDSSDPLSGYNNTDPITPGLDGDPVTKNLKLSYDTVNNTFSLWLGEVQLVNNLDLTDKFPAAGTEWAPDISYGAFYMRGHPGLPDNRCDNFLIESTNPLLAPPTIAQVKAMAVDDVNPQELDWIAVEDQVYVKGADMMPGASYDIDPDYDLFLNASDPNGPRYILLGVDESMSAPTTQYDAEFLTADGLLSTGCTLDYETTEHLGAIGQFELPLPQTTHDGPDLVVIMLDRQGDWGCSALKAQVQLLDASMNPIPGQVVQVACGSPEWTFTPADGGSTQHYDVTGVSTEWGATLREGSFVTRNNYVAFAIDVLTGIEIGGLRLTNPADAHTTPVEIFAIPQTGSYPWSDNSCEAGVYDPTDINEDCVTDLADFALLAGKWLDCNTVFNPSCW